MRLIVITPYYAPDLGPSAPMLTMLSEDLVARGHEVVVLAAVPHFPSGQVASEYRRDLWQWDEQNGVRVCRVRVPSGNRANLRHRLWTFLIYQLLVTVVGLGLHYDAALIINPAIETGLPFVVLAWLRRKPCVFAVWDLYPEVGVQLGIFHHRIVKKTVKFLEDFCLQRADAVQSLSGDFVENLRDRVGHPENLMVIPVWIDVNFIRPQPRQNRFSGSFGLNNAFVVLYAGNLGLSQGLDQILAVAERLLSQRYIRFVFVGDGPNREALVQQAEQKQLSNVQFIPFQPRERLPEVLATADLSLVSLQPGVGYGSLPSKTFSILASGRPILVSAEQDSAVVKIVRYSKAGQWVPPGNLDALCVTIEALSQDRQLCQELGANGRRYVEKHHSRSIAASQFEDLFSRII